LWSRWPRSAGESQTTGSVEASATEFNRALVAHDRRGAMMEFMQVVQMRAGRDPWAGQRPEGLTTRAQPLTTGAALILLVWALAAGFWPAWSLVTSAWLLVFGLLAEPLARRVGDVPASMAHSAAAFTALLILGFGLTAPHPASPLLGVAALLLILGLLSGPYGRGLISGRAAPDLALPLAALMAILVLVWTLALDSWWPAVKRISDQLPMGAVRLLLACLALMLLATVLKGGATLAHRLLAFVAASIAVTLLALMLGSPPAGGLRPAEPFWVALAIISVGLIVDPLARLDALPSARVLAGRVDELSRTRSGALDVQAAELRRIERDLHDGAQVRLIALSMKLGRAEELYRDDPKTAALLREAREDATAAIRELRELARGIAPPVLANRGLDAAVRSLAQRSGVEVTVSSRLTQRLLPAVEIAAYFVVAESLANVAKHALGARVEISLEERGGDLFVEITDFGPGGADPAGGGLTGLRQRIEALDGALHVTSPAGVGTQIEAVIPCGR
jgi:signal transduction histidine kinase